MSWTKLPTSRLALKKCSISLPFQIQIRHTLSIFQAPPTRRHTHLRLLETTVACCGGPSLKSLILFRATPPPSFAALPISRNKSSLLRRTKSEEPDSFLHHAPPSSEAFPTSGNKSGLLRRAKSEEPVSNSKYAPPSFGASSITRNKSGLVRRNPTSRNESGLFRRAKSEEPRSNDELRHIYIRKTRIIEKDLLGPIYVEG